MNKPKSTSKETTSATIWDLEEPDAARLETHPTKKKRGRPRTKKTPKVVEHEIFDLTGGELKECHPDGESAL